MGKESYLRKLRTIPIKLTLFPTVIALDSCYILFTIAFCLQLLSSTRLTSILLIGARRLLVYLSRLFLLLGWFPLATRAALEELNVFSRSSSISRWLWMSAKVFMFLEWLMTSFTFFQCSGWPGSARITFRTSFSSEISRLVALRSRTMVRMVRTCLAIVRVKSIWYCIHFRCKVRSLVADVWPNLTLRLLIKLEIDLRTTILM